MLPDPHVDACVSLGLSLGAARAAIGSGRDAEARRTAFGLRTAWQAAGGEVAGDVDWPEQAASWLRPARRLTDPAPDLWLLTGASAGLSQVLRRLVDVPSWRPDRTVLVCPAPAEAALLAGYDALDGLRWPGPDGLWWTVADGRPEEAHVLPS